MDIITDNLTKRFNNEKIFEKFSYRFTPNNAYAIIGPNGSGKSTLIQTLCGLTVPTSGNIYYEINSEKIDVEEFYNHITIVSPYIEFIEEFTLLEFLNFHQKFRAFEAGLVVEDVIEKCFLSNSKNKPIKNFSSGMKQRLKLALAFYGTSPILFFDEPTSNLDSRGIEWYKQEVKHILGKRLLFVASNQLTEYEMCNKTIEIANLKPKLKL